MKNKIIIIVLIIVVFFGVGYKFIKKRAVENSANQISWHAYIAQTLGYSFQYPTNWVLLGSDERDIHVSNTNLNDSNSNEYGVGSNVSSVEIQSVILPVNTDLVQAFKEYTNYSEHSDGLGTTGSFTETTINGQSAIVLESSRNVFIEKDSTHFFYVVVYGNAETDNVNKIISSINFTK